MKHNVMVIMALFFAVSIANSAESFDKIYKKNLSARGGIEAVKLAKSFIIDGELIRDDSVHFVFRAAYKLPNSMVVEYYQDGDTLALGFDGKTAWTLMPQISSNVIELPPSAAEEAIALTVNPVVDFINRLDIYKNMKSKIQVSDKDSLDSIPQFKLICPDMQGGADVIMINQTDYQISQINMAFSVGGKSLPAAIKLSDYRTSDTISLPYSVKIVNGINNIAELKIGSVLINPELKDEIFMMPK